MTVFCLFAFLITSCDNPFIETILGVKTISFNTNGGSSVPQQNLIKGEKVIKPGDPVKESSIFIGWFADNDSFLEEWDFNAFPQESMTLYAKWLAVVIAPPAQIEVVTQPKLEYNHGDLLDLTELEIFVVYEDGSEETIPFALFAFRNVRTMPENGERLTHDAHNETEIKIYFAGYDDICAFTQTLAISMMYDVTFKHEDLPDRIIAVSPGGFVNEPAVRTRSFVPSAGLYAEPLPESMIFAGWFTDNGAKWDFANNAINENLTLTEKWTDPKIDSVAPNDVGSAFNYFNNNAGNYILFIGADINIERQVLQNNDYSPTSKTLTIKSSGSTAFTLTRAAAFPDMSNGLFVIQLHRNLVLENIIIDGGNNKLNATEGPLVSIEADGSFIMNNGAVLQNNIGSYGGGGVYVKYGSKFIMAGGEIKNNAAQNGGGISCEGAFIMTGGIITNNNSVSNGGGVYVVNNGTITIGGNAVIKGNSGALKTSNVYLSTDKYINLGNVTNGAPAPAQGMEIGVRTAMPSGIIVNTNAAANHAQYFFADEEWDSVVHSGSQLKIAAGGSPEAPFLIYNEADLRAVGRGGTDTNMGDYTTGKYFNWDLDKHYKQMANIVLTVPSSGQSNWTPIGDTYPLFTGSYDGAGYTIKNLTIYLPAGVFAGMFGAINDGAVISNLGLIDVNITSGLGIMYNGGIAGVSMGSNKDVIQNCYVTGSITSLDPDGFIGGIVGSINPGVTVKNCFSAVKIIGNGFSAGGIIGVNDGIVTNCIALNNEVSGTSHAYGNNVGRIIGYFDPSFGTFANNYAWSGMTVTLDGSPLATASNAGGIHGADLTASEIKTKAKWDAAGFSFGASSTSPWVWENGKMPRLWNSAALDWPSYLIDKVKSDGITITFAPETLQPGVQNNLGNTTVISKTGAVKEITFTITKTPGNTYGTPVWFYGYDTQIGTGDSVTLNAANYAPGPKFISLEVTINNVPYSLLISFTVEE